MDIEIIITALLIFLIPLAVSLIVLPMLAALGPKMGLMDAPGRRKFHKRPKARVGGLGIALSLLPVCLLFIPSANLWGLYAGCTLLVIVGVLDDIMRLHYRWKLVAQVAAATFMVIGSHAVLSTFGNLLAFGPINLGILSVPLTIFCAVGLMNAINMIDGLDSLASGVVLIAIISFAVLSYYNQQPDIFMLCIAIMGALLGFLKYNVHPSRIFMGDTGSLNLGLIVAFLSIAVTQKQQSQVPPVAPLLILAIPIVDTVTVMLKRAAMGRSPFRADKTHLHHVFLRFGFNADRTAKIIIVVSALLSAIAVGGTIYRTMEYDLFYLFALFTVLYAISSLYVKEILKTKAHLRKKSSFKKIDLFMARITKMLAFTTKVSRKGERTLLKSPGQCAGTGAHSFTGKIVELSPFGFSAATKNALTVEDRLKVVINLNGGNEHCDISGTAQIRWSQKLNNGDGYKYGFKFVHMDKSKRQALHNYLDNLREEELGVSEGQLKKLHERVRWETENRGFAYLQTLASDSGCVSIDPPNTKVSLRQKGTENE